MDPYDPPTDPRRGVPTWAGLMPHSIAALGSATEPVERLIWLQSAVYRLVVALEELRLPRRPRMRHGAARRRARA